MLLTVATSVSDARRGGGCRRPLALVLLSVALCRCASQPPPPALYEEVVEPDENMEFARIVGDLRVVQEKRQPIQRGFHAKVHGCISGKFTPLANRPAWTRVGVFADDKPRPFVMRFTNGFPTPGPDADNDLRGAGIKLFQIDGDKLLQTQRQAQTQDFVLINAPTHFTQEPREFADFMIALNDGGAAKFWFLMTHPRMTWRVVRLTGREVPSLTQETYNSAGAFALGDKAVKYKLSPCGAKPATVVTKEDPDYLHKDLARYTATQETCWQLGLQLQTDAVATPIEDVTVEWPEAVAPTVAVAKFVVPRQDIEDPQVAAACERLEFTPWHAREEHRPLGKFNRVRRPVYAASQKSYNHGQSRQEPVDFPIKALSSAP